MRICALFPLSFRTWKSSALSSAWITWLRWPRLLLSGRLTATCSKISYVEPAAAEPSRTDLNPMWSWESDAEDAVGLWEWLLQGRHLNYSAPRSFVDGWNTLDYHMSNPSFISFQTRNSMFITWALHTEITRLRWQVIASFNYPVTVVVRHSAWLPVNLHTYVKQEREKVVVFHLKDSCQSPDITLLFLLFFLTDQVT